MRPIPPDLHPLVRKALRALKPYPRYGEFDAPMDDGLLRPPDEFLAIAVSPDHVERGGRLLDAVVRVLEGPEVGGTIVLEDGRSVVELEQDRFRFRLKQMTSRTAHKPTPAEARELKAHGGFSFTVPKWDWRAVDAFFVEISDHNGYGRIRKTLRDGKRARLEEKIAALPGILRELVQANREQEADNERRRRLWDEEDRIRREAAERAKREAEAREALFAQAERWRRATALRQYLAALEDDTRRRGVPETDPAWDRLTWARGIADEIDPLGAANAPPPT